MDIFPRWVPLCPSVYYGQGLFQPFCLTNSHGLCSAQLQACPRHEGNSYPITKSHWGAQSAACVASPVSEIPSSIWPIQAHNSRPQQTKISPENKSWGHNPSFHLKTQESLKLNVFHQTDLMPNLNGWPGSYWTWHVNSHVKCACVWVRDEAGHVTSHTVYAPHEFSRSQNFSTPNTSVLKGWVDLMDQYLGSWQKELLRRCLFNQIEMTQVSPMNVDNYLTSSYRCWT